MTSAKENKSFVFSAILIIAMMVCSIARNIVWRNELALTLDSLVKSSNNPRQTYNYALFLHRQGRLDEALFYVKKIINMGKQTWFVLSEMGAVYADMGLYEEALSRHQEAMKLARKPSERADVLEFIGITYIKMGDRDRAMESFQKAFSLKPDSATLNYYLGNIYRETDMEKALFHYEMAVSLNPDYYEASIDLANLYDDMGRPESALRLYKKAISIFPDAPEAYYNLGVFFERRGEVKKAVDYYRKAVMLDPEYPEPLARLRFLNAAY